MTIGFRAAGTFATRASPGTGALLVPVPAGTAAGDVMLLVATSYNSPGNIGINTPSGWTVIDTRSAWISDYRSVLYWKAAGASEPAVSLTTASSSYLDAVTVGFTGVDPTTPLDAAGAWAAASSSATVTVPSITTTTANAWWLFFTADGVGQLGAGSVPAGWTQRALTAITIAKYAISSVAVASPGATTATSFARTGSSAGQVSIGVALRAFVAAVVPVAGFTGSPLSGIGSATVTFTDTSTNAPTSWAWTFGDGGTSSAQNPSHTYAAAGTYNVTLTATNSAGSDTLTRTGYVTVSIGAGGAYADAVLSLPGLVGYWRLGETGAPWKDTSGVAPAADLTLTSPGVALTAHAAGAFGTGDDGAVNFNYDGHADSGGQFLNSTGAKNFSLSKLTVAAWVNVTASADSRRGHIAGSMAVGADELIGYGLQVIYPSRAIRFTTGGPRLSESYVETATPVVAGQWYFLAGSYDGGTLRLYVNGSLSASAVGSNSSGSGSSNPVLIGYASRPAVAFLYTNDYLLGTVDEAAIWGRALTPTEINSLYTSASASPGFVPQITLFPPAAAAPTATTWEQARSYADPANRPAVTGTTRPFASLAALTGALNAAAPGDLVSYTGAGILDIPGNYTGFAGRRYTGYVNIDLGLAASPNHVRFPGGGGAGLPAVGIYGSTYLRIYGGEITNPPPKSVGHDGLHVYGAGHPGDGATHHITWWNLVVHDTVDSGIKMLPNVPFPGGTQSAADNTISDCDIEATVYMIGRDKTVDTHPEPGTGQHCALLADTDPSGATYPSFLRNRVAIDGYNTGLSSSQGGGSIAELGFNDAASTISGCTLILRGNNTLFNAQQQTAGNGLNLWGDATIGCAVPFIQHSNATGSAVCNFPPGTNRSGVTVAYGRHTSTNRNAFEGTNPWQIGPTYLNIA